MNTQLSEAEIRKIQDDARAVVDELMAQSALTGKCEATPEQHVRWDKALAVPLLPKEAKYVRDLLADTVRCLEFLKNPPDLREALENFVPGKRGTTKSESGDLV